MKEFVFWDEDDLSNLPQDFKLVPFNVAYIDQNSSQHLSEKPKTSTSKKSPWVPKPLTRAKLGSSNLTVID